MDLVATGTLIAIIMGLVECLKIAISKVVKNGKGNGDFTNQDREKLNDLFTMHNVRDSNGMPIWYIPRSWNDTNEKLLDICTQIVYNQKSILKLMDKIESKL